MHDECNAVFSMVYEQLAVQGEKCMLGVVLWMGMGMHFDTARVLPLYTTRRAGALRRTRLAGVVLHVVLMYGD
jgi:hypothetical protein